MVTEADDRRAMTNGMRALLIRITARRSVKRRRP